MLHNFLRKLDGDPDICVRLLVGERECGRTRAEHILPWRESRITGMTAGGTLLYDDADPVPVHDEYSYAAMAAWICPASGRRMVRMCYCGPAAPLPRAYREYIKPAPWEGARLFVFEQRDAHGVYTWQQVIDSRTRVNLSEAEIWAALRDEYAYREDLP